MIQPGKYTLHEAALITKKDMKPEAIREYGYLKNALAENGDLKKYHTENSKILFPIDGLLERWNINHLHIDRSRFQVFFLQEGNELFIVNVCKHFERNGTDYHKTALLKIIEQNWPDKLAASWPQRHPKASNTFPSSYGWTKVDQLDKWLDGAIAVIEKEEGLHEIVFIDNARFVLRKANGTSDDNLMVFEV